MRLYSLLLGCVLMNSNILSAQPTSKSRDNAYQYSFSTLIGHRPMPLSAYQGKVLLIVNVASKCGFTLQYAGLQSLYDRYKDQGLVIIGVPSNDFGNQEPGTEADIAHFCQLNYGVSFPMAAKEVVSGKNAHPFYQWARQKLGWGSAPKWNFHKYLINRNGEIINHYFSTTSPHAPRLIKAIENALAHKNNLLN